MIINDNLLDRSIFNFIKDRVQTTAQWGFNVSTASAEVSDGPSFYSIISDQNGIYSSMYDLLCIPLMVACSRNNIKLSKLIRIRIGLILANEKQITHAPHVDYTTPHKTMLFYLTDSDGPTILYKQKHSGIINDPAGADKDSLEVDQHINPVENKSVIFDGLHFHSSTTPKNEKFRIVINYNFVD